MTYKEFNDWCNQRVCDGCWGINVAIFCIDVINQVQAQPFWKREKEWQKINEAYLIQDNVINPINNKMIEIYGKVL